MYKKCLDFVIKVRISESDYDFVKFLSEKTDKNISLVVRELIEKERFKYGYIKTDIDNKL